jgi:pimeloyl-ACP methyl ester carboxylesterase
MVLAAAISALYDAESWGELDAALTSAAAGDGSKIRAMYDGFFYQDVGFEDLRNTFEASVAISCIDDVDRTTVGDLAQAAPRLHTFFAPDELCARWPSQASETSALVSDGDIPTLLVGATKDPASPFDGVRATARASDNSRLITVEGNRHTSYLAVDCVTRLVDAYLIDLTDPGDAMCPAGSTISE